MTKQIVRVMAVVLAVLSVPFIAMQFTSEVRWSSFDFIIMGFLLATAGFSYEFALTKFKNRKERLIIGLVIVAVVVVIWAELAVGLFGTPFAES